MAARKKTPSLTEILDRLEEAYGPLVPSDDPVEAGLLAILAEHAPALSRVQSRQALRESFVDWNEMRVADSWDVSWAITSSSGGGTPESRSFAKAALKGLDSLHATLNRASFDRAVADPEVEVDALIAKMKKVPQHARAVMLAVLAPEGEWRVDKEISKVVQKLGLVKRTTSLARAGQGLAAIAGPDDRLRGHYLLARYAHRPDDADDPLAGPAKKTSARKPAKKAAAKKSAAKKSSSKKTAKKTASKKTTAKKPTKKAAKKSSKK